MLQAKLKELPDASGVYQYFDHKNALLYIGKAKSLKARVKSYFKFTPNLAPADKLSPRITKMVSEIANVEWIIVPTEHDALILENSLIKQLKPKYNILLRDDKTFPYIYIDQSEPFARFEITRKVLKGKNIKYFGPFSIGANEILQSIYQLIPLVQKKSCLKGKASCMFYQIERCKAPCENKISQEAYNELIAQSFDLLNNKHKMILQLNHKMQFLAENLRFEEAKELRDAIDKIRRSQIATTLDFASVENLDVICAYKQQNKAVCVQMFIRNGKLVSSDHKLFKDELELDLDEIYTRTIINYYNNSLPNIPSQILVASTLDNCSELEAFISQSCGTKVSINVPKIGKKKEIIEIATKNCQELLRIEANTHQNNVLDDIKELCELQSIPYRIEIFDNSHMMGQARVGAMVVWEDGFKNKNYRHYNLEHHDEFHQMQELLTRRAKDFAHTPPPNLWIIDGGETLMKLAQNIIESSGSNVDVIAISKEKRDAKTARAKGKAKDIIHTQNQSHKLLESDKRLQFIQKLRDEAHRFAITFHKKQKQKEDQQISLLKIKGFGEAKIKKLLNFFGTFEAIKNASTEQLQEIITPKDAIILHNFFHNSKEE